MKLILPNGRGKKREESLAHFSATILEYNRQASQRMSSRGWCYFLEGFNALTKGDFNKTQKAINECRKNGYLPIDFVAEDPKRSWSGVEHPTSDTPEAYLRQWLKGALEAEEYYIPNWWEDEKHYIQMMVEKIDLVNMFKPICREYHIPIVNAGGWYDIMERAIAARRFKDAEDNGLTPVILYFGDLDPYGLAISDFLKKNFYTIRQGTQWDPSNMIVERFGLNFEFIEEQGLTWIDNLESGSGKNMADMDNTIMRVYMAEYGEKKCEANAVMRASARPAAIQLCRATIEGYLGEDALNRFAGKRQIIRDRLENFREETGLGEAVKKALDIIDSQEPD
uniref:Putative terminase n=1 Tax=viral metagenome TaxID=1070528 RepID=A0A6M3J5L9_9ZZZZ